MDEAYLERCGGECIRLAEAEWMPEGLGSFAVSIRLPSVEAARHFEDASLHFVMIDADHRYESFCGHIRMVAKWFVAGSGWRRFWRADCRWVERAVRKR